MQAVLKWAVQILILYSLNISLWNDKYWINPMCVYWTITKIIYNSSVTKETCKIKTVSISDSTHNILFNKKYFFIRIPFKQTENKFYFIFI